MKATVQMEKFATTKGAVRYRGIDEDSPDGEGYLIGTLYLRKDGLAKHGRATPPERITVTIEGSE